MNTSSTASPFRVIDEAANGNAATIALKSLKIAQSNGKPTNAEVVVPFSGRAAAVYVLHGCAWAGTEQAKTGRYSLVYEDGTTEEIDLVVYGAGSEHKAVFERLEKESTIQDWSATSPQFENDRAKNVIIANPQNPLEYTRYVYTLKSVHPRHRHGD